MSIDFGNIGDKSSNGTIKKNVTITSGKHVAHVSERCPYQPCAISRSSQTRAPVCLHPGPAAGASCQVQLTVAGSSLGLLRQRHPDGLTLVDSYPTSPQVVALLMNAVQQATVNAFHFAPQTSRCDQRTVDCDGHKLETTSAKRHPQPRCEGRFPGGWNWDKSVRWRFRSTSERGSHAPKQPSLSPIRSHPRGSAPVALYPGPFLSVLSLSGIGQ